ncbi:MAG: FtsX-like permease family protein [Dehalococcoidia bacterium]|nr:FtsX-like permease family protein [Dehalococcoidia bacterium]
MKELFGLPMTTIAIALVSLLGVALLSVAYIGISNPTMARFGLRNIPRRGLQSVLVIVGLALGTLITTAAFVTGDTVDHSLTKDAYALFGRQDLDISWNGEPEYFSDTGVSMRGEQVFVDGAVVDALEAAFAGDEAIEAFQPMLRIAAPVTNLRTGDAKPAIQLSGVDAGRLDRVGGLTLTSGERASVSDLREGNVYLSERAATDLHAMAGDGLTVHLGDEVVHVRVAGVVRDELASGVLGMSFSSVAGGMVLPIETLRAMADLSGEEISAVTVSLRGGVRTTLDSADAAAARIRAYLDGEGAALFTGTGGLPAGQPVEVLTAKKDLVEETQLIGNFMTTIFLVLGMFSMAAGVMLIFMIFVMLAAERRSEMGMARAVGAQRRHLVQSFVAEGMAYSLLAGLIGVLLGVAASYGLTQVLLKKVGGDYFSLIEMKMTVTSVVVGYSLGVVITFITVVFASMKASHVNIVAAIRQLPDTRARERKRRTRWRWVIAGVPALAVPPLGIWWVFRKGFGLAWAWILGPLGIVLGVLLILLGKSSEVLFPFALGMSLVPLSAAAIARHLRAPARPLWTVVGGVLAAYWLLPGDMHDELFGKFNADIEMFVLSGIMIVVSFTLMIVFNARMLTGLFRSGEGAKSYAVALLLVAGAGASTAIGLALGDSADGLGELFYLVAGLLTATALVAGAAARFPSLTPALKMAVAYPLSNQFRTGMTIAMFSLIVFSLTVFSVLLANFDTAFLGGDARGNLDLVVTANEGSSVKDVPAALQESGSPVAAEIAGVGRTTIAGAPVQVSQGGREDNTGYYALIGADAAFFGELETTLDAMAEGYRDAESVWSTVREDADFAVVDGSVVGISFNEAYSWTAKGVTVEDSRFTPFVLNVTDPSGNTRTLIVIGVLKAQLPGATWGGIYVNETAYRELRGAPLYQRTYVRLSDGADAREAARLVESALAVRGVQAESVQVILDDLKAQNQAFNRMFQAFMALGLVVGIAGLGVIAFRSVVERRQQIGMLRAIGYQRGTVTLTFLLESSFIAVMGILSGVVGGVILGWSLLTSDSFTEGADIAFAMPWPEILLVIGASFAFSLAMTWWPSRGAARVPVAEALRYE